MSFSTHNLKKKRTFKVRDQQSSNLFNEKICGLNESVNINRKFLQCDVGIH